MKSALRTVANSFPVCLLLCMVSGIATAQGTGSIVESPAFTPGQASRQSAAGPSSGNNDAMSLLLEQIQQLQTEVQTLRGLIEEQGFELRKLQRDSLSRYTNMDERLSALESGASGNAVAQATTIPTPLNSVTPAAGNSAAGAIATPGASGTATTLGSSNPVATANISLNTGTTMPRADNFNAISTDASAAAIGTTSTVTSINPAAAAAASNQIAASAIATASPATSTRNTGRATLQPAVLSEQQLYQMAYDSVINSDFERSIAEFDQYLGNFPQGRFITNAHYWKGQAYLYLNRYEDARAAYEIIMNQFSDSPKLPDAMYGLGLAHQGLGNLDQARRLLNDIKRRFPNTGVANLADTRLLSLD